MAFCTYCGQQFQRNEHLERHLTTHTNVKRFKCGRCHISFARADVLQRHMVIHGDSETENENGVTQSITKVRVRTQNACGNCARMKAKCDANTPCNRCKNRNIECDRRPRKRRAAIAGSGISRSAAVPDIIGESEDEEEHSSHGRASIRVANSDAAVETETESPHDHSAAGPDVATTTNEYSELVEPPDSMDTRQETNGLDTGVELAAYMVDVTATAELGHHHLPLPDGDQSTLESTLAGWIANPSMLDFQLADFGKETLPQDPDTAAIGDMVLPTSFGSMGMIADSDSGGEQGDRYGRISAWRSAATPPAAEAPEHHAVLQAQEFWSSFQCNPCKDVAHCPRTAGVLLESLSHMPESDRLWGWLNFDFPSPASMDGLISVPLLVNIRDKLAAISQSFLRKALEVHRLDPAAATSSYPSPAADVSPGFLILPPTATLEHFLREYMRLFEPFYRLIPSGVFDANRLMNGANNTTSSLLILLMVSQGAMSDPTGEARRLSGGLTEVCRISLFDAIETQVSLCHHHLLIHSSLLFIIQASWSGDKWLMDIGLGQRGIYISIIRHGGLFSDQSQETKIPSQHQDLDELTHALWLQRERLIRLIYAWVTLDLELSLYQDVNPMIPVTELKLPLPSSIDLFLASDTCSWQQLQDTEHAKEGRGVSLTKQPSLLALFQLFLADELGTPQYRSCLNPTNLRLLLHPLHAFVREVRNLLSCFGGDNGGRRSFVAITKKSTELRMEELYSLLQRWLALYRRMPPVEPGHPDHAVMTVALITFHVIALNAVADVAEIERLARRRIPDAQLRAPASSPVSKTWAYSHAAAAAARSVPDPAATLRHAGQILHLVRSLDRKIRPPWWPATLYRATLVLWAASVFYGPQWREAPEHMLIDVEEEEKREEEDAYEDRWGDDPTNVGVAVAPALQDLYGGGTHVRLDNPVRTLECCLRAFRPGVATRLSEGVQRKLRQFLESRHVCEGS